MLGEFKSATELFLQGLKLLKGIKDVLPNKEKAAEITAILDKAEKEFQIAEGKAAQDFGYPLCRCMFPPNIMLETERNLFKCPACGKTTDTSPPSPVAVGSGRSKFRRSLDNY